MRIYKIDFSKIQGCGNSFIICQKQGRLPKNFNWGKLSKSVCNADYGIGADTLLVISKGRKAPFMMEVYNPDGSKAQVSGNGTRCVVRYLLEEGYSPRLTRQIETVKGLVGAEILNSDLNRFKVRVNLGRQVKIIKKMNLQVENRDLDVIYVDIGNPHAVWLVKHFDFDWHKLGNQIEHHTAYPKRVNVEFGRVINKNNIEVKIWERGVGAVLSSGTGASGAVLAGIYAGQLVSPVKARMEGGTLEIDFDQEGKNLFITGPAETICRGVYHFRG